MTSAAHIGYPGPWLRPQPWRPFPHPVRPFPQPGCGCGGWRQGHGNLPYAEVGNKNWFGGGGTQGYAVDLNGNGRYDRGRDGVLAMDLNRDGKVDKSEIEASRRRLMSMGGNYDFNGDGQVNFFERLQGNHLRRDMQKYDLDGDGRLSSHEFSRAGGRVLVDGNRDGNFQPWEQHSPYNFPTPGFGRGRLDVVDPYWNRTGVTHQPRHPWGF